MVSVLASAHVIAHIKWRRLLLPSTHPNQSNLVPQRKRRMQEKLEVAELLSEATFLEKKKTAQHQANESQVQEELAKAKALLEIFDAEEANMHIETPRRMLTFDNGKSAIKADMNTFDQDVLKDKQYF